MTVPEHHQLPSNARAKTKRLAPVGLLVFILLAALGESGCKKQEAVVAGRTLAEWIAASRGREAILRIQAYQSLRLFPGEPSAREALQAAVNNSSVPSRERYTAAMHLYRMTGSDEGLLAPVTAAIDAQFGRVPSDPSTKELEELVFWLGARAKSLTPVLRQARGRMTGSDLASAQARQGLDKTIQAIP